MTTRPPRLPSVAPITWPLIEASEAICGEHFLLEQLPSFEAASAEAYRRLGAWGDAAARVDLSPMFGVIWGAARVLARRLAVAGVRGERLLELGCGLALPSLVAARLGARVTATDQHPDTGALLARNLEKNGLSGRVRYEALDWRLPTPALPPASFDRVIASDVLYSRELPPLVASMFARFLRPGGVGWLADPGRAWLPEVVEAGRARGLEVTIDVDQDDHGEEAFVVAFTREGAAGAG